MADGTTQGGAPRAAAMTAEIEMRLNRTTSSAAVTVHAKILISRFRIGPENYHAARADVSATTPRADLSATTPRADLSATTPRGRTAALPRAADAGVGRRGRGRRRTGLGWL